eukprot:CAMPEP_0119420228 /NCGR_PEP_ID=MMETSP1335-20130426/23000_1 /TAXON_ID=259385 /ORGANISM="Chrysoculter rhomboideus, Strain RCC1486" /LENGTH=57 /DNA_ID=CAMNT_0007445573 /DNA_START=184 /DNA_END=354 /DNA_ORIENTATION=-
MADTDQCNAPRLAELLAWALRLADGGGLEEQVGERATLSDELLIAPSLAWLGRGPVS